MTDLPDNALVIGLGGNVGDVNAAFDSARSELRALGPLRSAPLYRTAPVGPAQPDFLNTAVCIAIASSYVGPAEVFAMVQALEHRLGRDRSAESRWGARPIDLDMLLWGTRTVCTPELEIPHPRLFYRRFVIDPLCALFGPDLRIAGKSLTELANAVAAQRVERIADTW